MLGPVFEDGRCYGAIIPVGIRGEPVVVFDNIRAKFHLNSTVAFGVMGCLIER